MQDQIEFLQVSNNALKLFINELLESNHNLRVQKLMLENQVNVLKAQIKDSAEVVADVVEL